MERAKDRLRIAQKASDEIAAAASYANLCDSWYIFLAAYKGIYTSLEQAAKGDVAATTWYAQRKAEQKSDDLLRYIFQARNDQEHGLGRSVLDTDHSYVFSIPDSDVENRQVQLKTEADGSMTIFRPDGGPIELVRSFPSFGTLLAVRNRGIEYLPPGRHLGVPIGDLSPKTAAALAVDYAKGMVADAARFEET